MKTFVKYLFIAFFLLFSSNGFAQKSLTDFIDGMKNSSNPEQFVPQIKKELTPYLNGPGSRKTIKEAFQYFLGKNDKIATCIGYLLCQSGRDPKEWYEIIKQLPVSKKFYAQKEEYGSNSEDTIYGGCLSNIILFTDGRVVILDIPEADIDNYDNLASLTSRMPEFVNDFYNNNKQAFLYDPSGKCMLGYFKEKGTEIYDNMNPECSVFERPARDNRLHQYKDNLQYELVAGINLDFNTGVFKPTYYGYDTPDEAIKAKGQKKAEAIKKYNATLTKMLQAQKTALIKKYGEKAYNYIKQGKIYVGMPAGILTEYKEIQADGTAVQLFSFKGTFRNNAGVYSLYEPSGIFQLFRELGVKLDYNKIYVRNRKVTGWR